MLDRVRNLLSHFMICYIIRESRPYLVPSIFIEGNRYGNIRIQVHNHG